MIKNISIPVSATGTAVLNPYFDQGRNYLLQAYQYGVVSTTNSSADNSIGSTGTGITFTPNGSLTISNAPLQTFIDKENIAYANTVSTGVGHVYGLINLFTNPFNANPSTNLSINFTSAPSVYGGSNQIRTIWIEQANV
jgi:hypothetical protein